MRSCKNIGETNGGRGASESSPVESAADFEVASLKEHDRAKLSFIEAKANLLTVLNNRLQEAGCGPLYSLHYQRLLHYVADVEAYQKHPYRSSPMLHLECDRTVRYQHLSDFRAYAPGMDLIHSELAPEVLQSRKNSGRGFFRAAVRRGSEVAIAANKHKDLRSAFRLLQGSEERYRGQSLAIEAGFSGIRLSEKLACGN